MLGVSILNLVKLFTSTVTEMYQSERNKKLYFKFNSCKNWKNKETF